MKLMYNVFLLASAFSLLACGAGNGNNGQTISAAVASGQQCVLTSANSQCGIVLTYNANGVSGLTLGSNPAVLLSQFTLTGLTNCPVPTGNQSQICNLILSYKSNGTPVTNQSIAFTLGTVKSNTIDYSGQ